LSSFLSRLSEPTPLILDGATGTELNRRGVATGLPLWSANALLTDSGIGTLRQIHLDYLEAGADILTANTFRTHRRALAGKGRDARALTLRSVEVAREAVAQFGAQSTRTVAGSIAPLEDCYSPELVPNDAQCRTEHAERIHHLVEAGVDLLLIETMNTIREAAIAARLAVISGLPTLVSFVCGVDGRLLSGETFTAAADVLLPIGIAALGVNCGPAHALAAPLAELRRVCGPEFPLVAYGNVGYADDKQGWVNTDAVDPDAYARWAVDWPAHIIGGCCGTTPAHIQKLKNSARR